MQVEMIVRAQRFDAFPKEEFEPVEGMNHFEGRIKDRSYMGGEVSYFIELGNGREIHIISMMRTGSTRLAKRSACRWRPITAT
jgi:hypothetical protein